MNKLLEEAITTARTLPLEMQDEVARLVLLYVGSDQRETIQLTPDEEADLAEADAEIARGEFAADDDVAAVFAKYRR